MTSLSIIFAGAGEFGLPTLKALVAAGHRIVQVVSQPDRPAGRGRKLTPTPIAQYAIDQSLPLERTKRKPAFALSWLIRQVTLDSNSVGLRVCASASAPAQLEEEAGIAKTRAEPLTRRTAAVKERTRGTRQRSSTPRTFSPRPLLGRS